MHFILNQHPQVRIVGVFVKLQLAAGFSRYQVKEAARIIPPTSVCDVREPIANSEEEFRMLYELRKREQEMAARDDCPYLG
jgi:hypothetical protein